MRRRDHIAHNASQGFAFLFIGLALAFTLVAARSGDTFYFRLATEALIYAGLAMSVDLLLGFTGLLSLGQALFFGLGAYTSALVLKHVGPSFWTAMGVTLLASTAAGIVGGFTAIRARGVYFALITFGMAQVVSKIVYNTRELGASDGIIGIPVIQVNFFLFKVDTANAPAFFLTVLSMTMGLYFCIAYLLRTPFDDPRGGTEQRVPRPVPRVQPSTLQDAGVRPGRRHGRFFRALYPMLRGFVSPELMYFAVSGDAVITVVIGGLGTLIGPVYGSVILTGLKSVIGTYTGHYQIVIGALFMISVIAFPKGLVGYLRPLLEKLLDGRGKKP